MIIFNFIYKTINIINITSFITKLTPSNLLNLSEAAKRTAKAYMSCRVAGDHSGRGNYDNMGNYGYDNNNNNNNGASADNRGYHNNKGYDTVSCAETRCSRKRRSIIRRSTSQLNPVEVGKMQ